MRIKANKQIWGLVGRADLSIISLAYFASQVFFWSAGGKFDASPINFTMHLLDPELLKTRLFESLWYMHMQPPLFNLFTAFGLKLFPHAYTTFFAAAFFLLGLGLAWMMYWLIRALGVPRKLGLVAIILYILGPADMFYRNWYFYSYPVMAMLVFCSILLYLYLTTKNKIWGHSFFALMAILMLIRYSYHIIWFLVIAAGLLIICPTRRRQIAMMALMPALICLLWMGKNYYLFGSFSMSTWLGWSLSKITSSFLTPSELNALKAEGKISSLAGIWPGREFEVYENFLEEKGWKWHPAPALNQRYNSTTAILGREIRNYNYINYITISRIYTLDSFTVIRFRPAAYLRGISSAALLYFMPTRLFEDEEQKGIIPAYHRVWTFLGGSVGKPNQSDTNIFRGFAVSAPHVCWLVVLFYIFAPLVFIFDLVRGKGMAQWDHARLLTIGFILFNMIYVSATGILLDFGENNRFRSEIVPLTVVIAAVVLQRLLKGRRVKPVTRDKDRNDP